MDGKENLRRTPSVKLWLLTATENWVLSVAMLIILRKKKKKRKNKMKKKKRKKKRGRRVGRRGRR